MTKTEIVKKEEVMEAFDKLDETQALAELKGASLQEYVYSFKDRGVIVTGLSLVGVRETVREMNKRGFARTGISDKAPIINETEDYIEIQTYAKDELNGGGYWGIKRQNKKFGTGTVNRFCMEQALSKAQRNALRGLIPEPFVKEMIATYLGEGKGKNVTSDEVRKTLSDASKGGQKARKETKGTSDKGSMDYPSNEEFLEKFDWEAHTPTEVPPLVKDWTENKGVKIPPYTELSNYLYHFSVEVLPKEVARKVVSSTVDKPTWEMTYEELKKVYLTLKKVKMDAPELGRNEPTKEEQEQIARDFDEQEELGK